MNSNLAGRLADVIIEQPIHPNELTIRPDSDFILSRIITLFFSLVILAGACASITLVLMGIFQLIFSKGDKLKQRNAKQKLIFGVISIFAVFAFFVATNVVTVALGLGSLDSNLIPTLNNP